MGGGARRNHSQQQRGARRARGPLTVSAARERAAGKPRSHTRRPATLADLEARGDDGRVKDHAVVNHRCASLLRREPRCPRRPLKSQQPQARRRRCACAGISLPPRRCPRRPGVSRTYSERVPASASRQRAAGSQSPDSPLRPPGKRKSSQGGRGTWRKIKVRRLVGKCASCLKLFSTFALSA